MTDYESVRIYLSFSMVSALDETVEPLITTTQANKVFIKFRHKQVDAKWQLAMPIDNERGDDTVALNVIGLGAFLVDTLCDVDPAEDIDAKRLRLSPAYARPLRR